MANSFHKLITFIDSLFWETRVFTTHRIIRKQTSSDATPFNRKNGFRIMTNTSTVVPQVDPDNGYTQDGMIYFTGKNPIVIPDIVKNRSPLMIDGQVDRTFRAAHMTAPIIICVNVDTRKLAYIDGEPLSRTDCIKNVTKKKAFVMMATCREIIERLQFKMTGMVNEYKDLHISFFHHQDWIYFNILKKDGIQISLRQDHVKQFETESDCVKMAYVFTRALLLDISGSGIDITNLDEDDFARVILSLLLASFVVNPEEMSVAVV